MVQRGSWVWPLLGMLLLPLLPLTTLFYMFMWSPVNGLQGFDWRWLFLAVALDIGNAAGSAYTNRDTVPASIPGGTRPATT